MRKILPDLVSWLDSKLAANGLAQNAIATKDARLLFRLAAEASVGIRELTGNNDGPLVELMQKTVDGVASREPWCCAAIQSWLAYAELKTGVVSPVASTELCLAMWNETPEEQRVKTLPAPGAICIWRHGDTSNGHTGVLIAVAEPTFRAVEGNTEGGLSPTGAVERDGGGVYATVRSLAGAGTMKVVGFLKPF